MMNIEGETEAQTNQSNCELKNSTSFRDTKNISQTSSIATVIATENWILKSTPYRLQIAHQSDTALIAVKVCIHFTLSAEKGHDNEHSIFATNRVTRIR